MIFLTASDIRVAILSLEEAHSKEAFSYLGIALRSTISVYYSYTTLPLSRLNCSYSMVITSAFDEY